MATLYGPSKVTYTLPDGIKAVIEEQTAYPFDEKIDFTFHFYKNGKEIAGKQAMDFTYRIPEWCDAEPAGFKTISKEWQSGETYTVQLPMRVKINESSDGGLTIERGPILYAYPIPENREEDTAIYENLAGKLSGNPEFKSWSMTPAGKWNYAIDAGKLDQINVKQNHVSGFPFDLGNSPVTIEVPVVGVKGWKLEEDRYTPALPKKVVPEESESQVIELVPYGSTTLRLTTFPVYSE